MWCTNKRLVQPAATPPFRPTQWQLPACPCNLQKILVSHLWEAYAPLVTGNACLPLVSSKAYPGLGGARLKDDQPLWSINNVAQAPETMCHPAQTALRIHKAYAWQARAHLVASRPSIFQKEEPTPFTKSWVDVQSAYTAAAHTLASSTRPHLSAKLMARRLSADAFLSAPAVGPEASYILAVAAIKPARSLSSLNTPAAFCRCSQMSQPGLPSAGWSYHLLVRDSMSIVKRRH